MVSFGLHLKVNTNMEEIFFKTNYIDNQLIRFKLHIVVIFQVNNGF